MPPLCPPSSTVTVVTSCDNLKHHFYGDDSQVLNSALTEIQIQTSETEWHKTNFNRMAKGQKRCSSKQNKNCPLFLPTLFSLAISQSQSDSVKSPGVLLYNTLSMKNVISEASKSCYYFADLALCRSIFPTKLWIWSPHSFCHASTTALLSFLVCLIPVSMPSLHSQLCWSSWKKKNPLHLCSIHAFQICHSVVKCSVNSSLVLLSIL